MLTVLFFNIGNQPASLDNLKSAQSLKSKIVYCPPNANVQIFLHPHGQEPFEYTGEWNSVSCEAERFLSGMCPELALWSVTVNDHNLHFGFRNITSERSTDGYIIISDCSQRCLLFEVEAAAFGQLVPARILQVQINEDAAWEKCIKLSEWSDGYGVRIFITYPEAKLEHFDKISKC